jgi:hypothetical protein
MRFSIVDMRDSIVAMRASIVAKDASNDWYIAAMRVNMVSIVDPIARPTDKQYNLDIACHAITVSFPTEFLTEFLKSNIDVGSR